MAGPVLSSPRTRPSHRRILTLSGSRERAARCALPNSRSFPARWPSPSSKLGDAQPTSCGAQRCARWPTHTVPPPTQTALPPRRRSPRPGRRSTSWSWRGPQRFRYAVRRGSPLRPPFRPVLGGGEAMECPGGSAALLHRVAQYRVGPCVSRGVHDGAPRPRSRYPQRPAAWSSVRTSTAARSRASALPGGSRVLACRDRRRGAGDHRLELRSSSRGTHARRDLRQTRSPSSWNGARHLAVDVSGGLWRGCSERGATHCGLPCTRSTSASSRRPRAVAGPHCAVAGLGRHGQTCQQRAAQLHAAGFGAEPMQLRHGILVQAWLAWRPAENGRGFERGKPR